MIIDDDRIHADTDRAVIHLADADPSHIFIIVYGADQYLGIRIRVALRRGDIFKDRLKERLHIPFFICKIQYGNAGFGGRIDEGAV